MGLLVVNAVVSDTNTVRRGEHRGRVGSGSVIDIPLVRKTSNCDPGQTTINRSYDPVI